MTGITIRRGPLVSPITVVGDGRGFTQVEVRDQPPWNPQERRNEDGAMV